MIKRLEKTLDGIKALQKSQDQFLAIQEQLILIWKANLEM